MFTDSQLFKIIQTAPVMAIMYIVFDYYESYF